MYNDEFELTFDLADAGPKKEQRRPTLPEREEAAEAAPLAQETREIPASAAPEPEPEPVGLPQPAAPAANGWTCSCGQSGNTGRFCTSCGKPKPEAPTVWVCSCGTKNSGKFCFESLIHSWIALYHHILTQTAAVTVLLFRQAR